MRAIGWSELFYLYAVRTLREELTPKARTEFYEALQQTPVHGEFVTTLRLASGTAAAMVLPRHDVDTSQGGPAPLRFLRGFTNLPWTPFARIEAITHVYFVPFDPHVRNLAGSGIAYQQPMLSNTAIHNQFYLSIPTHVTIKNEFIDARTNYAQCINTLLDELKDYAKRELQ